MTGCLSQAPAGEDSDRLDRWMCTHKCAGAFCIVDRVCRSELIPGHAVCGWHSLLVLYMISGVMMATSTIHQRTQVDDWQIISAAMLSLRRRTRHWSNAAKSFCTMNITYNSTIDRHWSDWIVFDWVLLPVVPFRGFWEARGAGKRRNTLPWHSFGHERPYPLPPDYKNATSSLCKPVDNEVTLSITMPLSLDELTPMCSHWAFLIYPHRPKRHPPRSTLRYEWTVLHTPERQPYFRIVPEKCSPEGTWNHYHPCPTPGTLVRSMLRSASRRRWQQTSWCEHLNSHVLSPPVTRVACIDRHLLPIHVAYIYGLVRPLLTLWLYSRTQGGAKTGVPLRINLVYPTYFITGFSADASLANESDPNRIRQWKT